MTSDIPHICMSTVTPQTGGNASVRLKLHLRINKARAGTVNKNGTLCSAILFVWEDEEQLS